ncbi:MAG: hypothetical protein ACTHMM_21220 [Agriterribacter sp.]
MSNKLMPLSCNLSKGAHEKILLAAAQEYLSKSEWLRRLVLNTVGLAEEIDAPRTNNGVIAELKAREEKAKKESRKAKRLANSPTKD